MSTKKLLLFFLCIVSLSGICKTTDPPVGSEKIELLGSLDLNYGPDDVEAYVYQNAVYIYFHQNFGNVSIINSRVLYYLGTPVELCYNVFAYTIDSYLDLAQQRFLNNNEVIVQWPGLPMEIFYNHLGYTRQYPKIQYGTPVIIIEHDDPIN